MINNVPNIQSEAKKVIDHIETMIGIIALQNPATAEQFTDSLDRIIGSNDPNVEINNKELAALRSEVGTVLNTERTSTEQVSRYDTVMDHVSLLKKRALQLFKLNK